MPNSDSNYDDRGRWTREDRPEMLSDRLGYDTSVGDDDWKRIAATREQAQGEIRPKPSDGTR